MTDHAHINDPSQAQICPGCENHCLLSDPLCGRGRMYLQMQEKGLPLPPGPTAERNEQHADLLALFHRCNHLLGRGRQSGQSQGRILMILHQMGGATSQKELQEILQIRAASLSELLSKLEKNALITRSKEETDRRSSLIQLTEGGKAHIIDHAEARQRAAQTLFQCLTSEEQLQLAQLLTKLSQDWTRQFSSSREAHGPDAAKGPHKNCSQPNRGRRGRGRYQRLHEPASEILHPEHNQDSDHF